jgi:hypothetical protein
MSRKIGSQIRETLEEAEMVFVGYLGEDKTTIVLKNDLGEQEIWGLNNDHAGYTIEVEGMGYEFIRDYKAGRDGLPWQETPSLRKMQETGEDYAGCTIVNIHRGTKASKRDDIVYAELRDKNGALMIAATLEYITESLKIRLPEHK